MFARSLTFSPRFCWPILAASLLSVSCSGGVPTYPVKGTVTVKGQPAAGAVIRFVLSGPPAAGADPVTTTAVSKEDGTFEVEATVQGKYAKGAPAGDYMVTVMWPDTPAHTDKKPRGMGHENVPPAKDKLGGRYSRDKGIPVKVIKGENDVPLKLE